NCPHFPVAESQARALVRFTDEDQCRVWVRAVERCGSTPPTALAIRQVATELGLVRERCEAKPRNNGATDEIRPAPDAPSGSLAASQGPDGELTSIVRELWRHLRDGSHAEEHFAAKGAGREAVQQAVEALVKEEGRAAGALLYAFSYACGDATYDYAPTGA